MPTLEDIKLVEVLPFELMCSEGSVVLHNVGTGTQFFSATFLDPTVKYYAQNVEAIYLVFVQTFCTT